MKLLHVSDISFVHHQEFLTVHTTMVYVIQVCRQLASRIRLELRSILILLASCLQTWMTYTIAVCTVRNSWWWTKEMSETCRVSFQNKFEKLVHLVGFIIRICHDARSHEPKNIIAICSHSLCRWLLTVNRLQPPRNTVKLHFHWIHIPWIWEVKTC